VSEANFITRGEMERNKNIHLRSVLRHPLAHVGEMEAPPAAALDDEPFPQQEAEVAADLHKQLQRAVQFASLSPPPPPKTALRALNCLQVALLEKAFTDTRQLVLARYSSLAADHLAQSANAERTGYLWKQGDTEHLPPLCSRAPFHEDLSVRRWAGPTALAEAMVCAGGRFPILLLLSFRTLPSFFPCRRRHLTHILR
jgi:hypothetical protein